MNLFLSYNHSESAAFVGRVKNWLDTQPFVQHIYYAPDSPAPGPFQAPLVDELAKSDAFIGFLTESLSQTQAREIDYITGRAANHGGPPAQDAGTDVFVVFVELSSRIPEQAKYLSGGYPSHRVDPSVAALARRVVTPAEEHEEQEGFDPREADRRVDLEARKCAREIVGRLRRRWQDADGIPEGYPWAYEKDIIGMYQGLTREERLDQGLPAEWPDVPRLEAALDNPLELKVIGRYRPANARVMVDARYQPGPDGIVDPDPSLSFPEAGPREKLAFPRHRALRVGILVSGGIAPGINAVIDSIVTRHKQYWGAFRRNNTGRPYALKVLGYVEGFKSLITGGQNPIELTDADTHSHEGGSILGTSREEELVGHDSAALDKSRMLVHRFIQVDRLDILYIIGGDGSMRGARAISTLAKRMRAQGTISDHLTVVGIPKTMDNDILWAWQSFGFISAVEQAKAVVRALHTEARSNPRLGIIQLFGTSSGFVAIHTALGSGVCDAVLIPEVPFTLRELSQHICNLLQERDQSGPGEMSPHGIVLMSEAAVPMDWKDYVHDDAGYPELHLSEEELEALRTYEELDRHVIGQTPDHLRSASLRLVAGVLSHDIRNIPGDSYWSRFRVFTNEPRHIIRAVEPSVADVILAQRLGTLAVDGAMAGYHEFMVSQWLTEYVFVPLELVVLGRKRVPQQGIFWKTVVATTGQAEPEEGRSRAS
jgi:6-phosphofructokinase 1